MIGENVGHYRIIDRIGKGGMGEVFLAEDTRLDRKAAIKFLPADMADDDERRRRFLTEAKSASALNHPHVCVVYDVGANDTGVPFIAMEFAEGEPLDQVLESGSLDIPRAVKIASHIADALDAAHSRLIVHRDIKPANVSIGERDHVKVLDFGLAKRISFAESEKDTGTLSLVQTQEGQVIGTPGYMSPEQALGKEVDHRSDIFSLGVVLYEMLTGRLPFGGTTIGEIITNITTAQPYAIARFNYDVPAELERITLKCLQKPLERRYQTARELMIDLENLGRELENQPVKSAIGQTTCFAEGGLAGDGAAVADSSDSLETLKKSEILLNYAPVDDRPMTPGKPGWVSQLHQNLELRVEQLSGEKVAIGRLAGESEESLLRGALNQHLPDIKAMISVVSPPFLKSESCCDEVREFWQAAAESGGPWVDEKPRLLKVLKTAIGSEEIPKQVADIFSPLLGFEFFETDSETGRVREFDEAYGPTLKQRFFERVYDLAFDVSQVVKALKHSQPGSNDENSDRRWIYLATTTSDVQDERDRVRRELVERGHVVLPDGPLPMLAGDAASSIEECLSKCSVAIHLLGRNYGVTPEDSSESMPALQTRLSARFAIDSDMDRFIWIPGDCEPHDERQGQFIEKVQVEPELHHGAEVIQGNLNTLKNDLVRKLTAPKEIAEPAVAATSSDLPKVYLICEPRDEESIESLEDFLFDRGVEVCLPAFDGNEEEAEALHRHNLLTCDAALVYYGAAPKAWVDIKLRELLKAAGYGRDRAIEVQGVYVAPPDDRRKARFRSHQAQIIRQDSSLPEDELVQFLDALKESV